MSHGLPHIRRFLTSAVFLQTARPRCASQVTAIQQHARTRCMAYTASADRCHWLDPPSTYKAIRELSIPHPASSPSSSHHLYFPDLYILLLHECLSSPRSQRHSTEGQSRGSSCRRSWLLVGIDGTRFSYTIVGDTYYGVARLHLRLGQALRR